MAIEISVANLLVTYVSIVATIMIERQLAKGSDFSDLNIVLTTFFVMSAVLVFVWFIGEVTGNRITFK